MLGVIKIINGYFQNIKSSGGSRILFSTVIVQTGIQYHASFAAAKGTTA
jgi:hypothetical protein